APHCCRHCKRGAGELLSVKHLPGWPRQKLSEYAASDIGTLSRGSRRQADCRNSRDCVAEHLEQEDAGRRPQLEEGATWLPGTLPFGRHDERRSARGGRYGQDEEDERAPPLGIGRVRTVRIILSAWKSGAASLRASAASRAVQMRRGS